ncbi:MAG: ParB/RepB/Spo0J family partition protein [Planctomycetaceae bacterium]|nr:ParB/RepB/Spo0J family partition protein [Planctomycetaceae bacterium]
MAKEKRLGRGLEALLGKLGGVEQDQFDESVSSIPSDVDVDADWILQKRLESHSSNQVDISLIDRNPFQPRREFDEVELERLAGSLRTHGLLQPIVLRRISANDSERFQIIAGERRYRAAMQAGWSQISAYCLEDVDDRTMIEIALTENVQRKDLNAIEKAVAFANYLEVYGGTHEELAKRLELDRSTVTNLLRLLDLAAELQDSVCKGELTMGHARALLPLEKFEQIEVGNRIKLESWSVRETERFVRELLESGDRVESDVNADEQTWAIVGKDGKSHRVTNESEQILQLEEDFRKILGGVKVKLIQKSSKGNGKLVINFANHAEFDNIYNTICKTTTATKNAG